MQELKNYLIDEYKDKAKGFVAVDFKFTHSVSVKIDKKSNVPLRNDILKISMTFYDKDMNKLYTSNISFENDILPKATAKKLINIAPKELENKFNAAKKSICKNIFDELKTKQIDIESKVNELKKYVGEERAFSPEAHRAEGIVPSQFKGELINPIDDEVKTKSKVKYDM